MSLAGNVEDQPGVETVQYNEAQKGGKLDVRPTVFQYTNHAYWEADESIEMTLDRDGCFVGAKDGMKHRS
jgi:hypothetical protein